MMPSFITLGAAAYGLFLLAAAWGFDIMASRSSNKTSDMQTGAFKYLESHDAWQCPEDQWLWPSSFDPDNRVMRYRANPTVCNSCPVKNTCTVSSHGREVTRAMDPWPHSDSGRFHRGIALAVAVMALLLPLVSLIPEHDTIELVVIAAVVLIILGAGVYPLARHLWTTPANAPAIHVPEMDNHEAEIAKAADRYARRYVSDSRRPQEA